jgi:hypothetical protein
VASVYADYVFTYFSGHGGTQQNTEKRFVSLQDGNILDINLFGESPRQVVMLTHAETKLLQR